MKYIKYYIIIAIMILTKSIAFGQQTPKYWFGGYANLNLNVHSADFKTLPGYFSCCPSFESGSGTGGAFGALGEMPLNDELFFGLRFGYSVLDADLTKRETIGNVIDYGIKSQITKAVVEHKISSKIRSLGIEPSINLKLFEKFYTSFGLKLFVLTTKQFSQSERIISPDNVLFSNEQSTIRNIVNDQQIPDAGGVMLSGVLGLGYNIDIGHYTFLSPELKYEMSFSNISSVSWKPGALEIGMALKIPVLNKIKATRIEQIYQRDTVDTYVKGLKQTQVTLIGQNQTKQTKEFDDYIADITTFEEHYKKEIPELPHIEAELKVYGIESDGTTTQNPKLTIEELETEEVFPLLPQVFFSEANDDINSTRMILLDSKSTGNFKEDSLEWNQMTIYHNLLNIIGSRMQANADAAITIVGNNCNIGSEAGNTELSEKRAAALKTYLVNVWGINGSRIQIKFGNLPEKPANNARADGIEENRRAEIYSDHDEILKPVTLKEIHSTANPPVIKIEPVVKSEAAILHWNLDIYQNTAPIRSLHGDGKPESINWEVEYKPIPKQEKPVEFALTVYDEFNNKTTAKNSIAIEQKTIRKKRIETKDDKKVERFSLILFNYDNAEITDRQSNLLQNVREKIQDDSKVIISGYTDRTGDKVHNRELSRNRALSALKTLGIPETQTQIQALSNNVLLFDNNLPEGRSYSRTVKIIIETPIK